jgi:putative heme-binding domain-containing protein
VSPATCGLDQRFRLAAQDVRLQPVVQVQPHLRFRAGRHPVAILIEPRLGLAQPVLRLLGLPDALVGQGQPQPVQDRRARLGVGPQTLLEERHRFLEPAGTVRQGASLGQRPEFSGALEFLLALRMVRNGWTVEQRKEYFNWFHKAAGSHGGNSFHGFLKNIRTDAVGTLSDQERSQLRFDLAVEPKPMQPKFLSRPRTFVKKWTVDELVPIVEKGLNERDYDRGHNLFGEAKCFACHRFNNEGGGAGPDLTIVSGRFGARDLLESILEPSKVISDQYQSVVISLNTGKSIHGRIVNLAGDTIHINTDLLNPNQLVGVNRNQIETMSVSKISMMPENLMDTYTQDEILDLVAYLFSRGDRGNKMFRKNKE